MKYLPLVWAGLWRKPLRAVLTLLSVVMAFMLFGILIGFKASFDHVENLARADRIYITTRFGPIPFSEAMGPELASIPGVTHVTTLGFIGGYYQKPRNQAFVMMVSPSMQAVWPELPLTSAQYSALAANPSGIFVSREMARHLGVKPGQAFPVTTSAPPRADGARAWTFQILGLVDDMDQYVTGYAVGTLKYYDEARPLAAHGTNVNFRVLVDSPARGEEMTKRIDQAFANSGTPVRSITEKTAYDSSTGDVDIPFLTEAIAAAGLFMILFLTGNSIAQSVRERVPEFAVLKTIGFSDAGVMALVFTEAAMPCLLGAVIGLGLARLFGAALPHLLPPGIGLPPPYLPPSVLLTALGAAALVAALSAILPAARIARLDVATALSGR